MAGPLTPGEGGLPESGPKLRSAARFTLLDAGGMLLSVLLLLALWQGVSLVVSAQVMPSPLATTRALAEALPQRQIWSDIGVTLSRILAAFALAMTIGIAFGSALGTLVWFRRIFNLWVMLAASTPSILYIVVVYLALGLTESAAIVGGALVVAPVITFNVWQGMRTLDPGLSEMARAFGVPRWTVYRRVLFPQTLPFLFAAARLGLTITWKIMIFIELLGRSSGVGYRIQQWYELFNMQQVLVSALPFLAVMLLIEVVILRTLERRLFRWVREEAR
ncbi:MAG: ABC transporter permease [Vicinamibacterales bacterium]